MGSCDANPTMTHTSTITFSFSAATMMPWMTGIALRFLNSNPVWIDKWNHNTQTYSKIKSCTCACLIGKSVTYHRLCIIKPKFLGNFCSPLNYTPRTVDPQPRPTNKEAIRVNVHGICTAPWGNMDGTYKSMLPKSFFGIFPYPKKEPFRQPPQERRRDKGKGR